MKKSILLCGLLAALSASSFAFVGSKPVLKDDDLFTEDAQHSHVFYSVIINNSNMDVDIYAKNDLHWDNWGWCDGDKSGKLSVHPGETKVYCGGTSNTLNRVGWDAPRLQHEWWFNTPYRSWQQTYSEQWLLDVDAYDENLVKMANKNIWSYNSDFNFMVSTTGSVSNDYVSSITSFIKNSGLGDLSDQTVADQIRYNTNGTNKNRPKYKLINNTVVFYEINKNNTIMTPYCYSLPVKFDWHHPETMRQGENKCPTATQKGIWINL